MRSCHDHLAETIARAGGWIPFDQFMALALYAPGVGYYEQANPIGSLTAGGDFITAPELSRFFAGALARQLDEWFEDVAREVIEFGAGSGQLAADLLLHFAQCGKPLQRYRIVEVSAQLRARQHATLAREVPELLPCVQWLPQLPTRLEGVVLANELLDAMPVRLFVGDRGAVQERGVALDANSQLVWADRAADEGLAGGVAQALTEAGWSLSDARTYQSEWPEQASAWVRTIAERLRQGVLLVLDYGFPRPEFYHRARHSGTLMCHRGHRSDPNPLLEVGQRDITAHVDFTAIARAASAGGLELIGYTSQARFLLNCGILEALVASTPSAAQRSAVQLLLSEAEMGELFKVIAFADPAHRTQSTPLGFVRGDRSMMLTPTP